MSHCVIFIALLRNRPQPSAPLTQFIVKSARADDVLFLIEKFTTYFYVFSCVLNALGGEKRGHDFVENDHPQMINCQFILTYPHF
jgi:hypothetical protein